MDDISALEITAEFLGLDSARISLLPHLRFAMSNRLWSTPFISVKFCLPALGKKESGMFVVKHCQEFPQLILLCFSLETLTKYCFWNGGSLHIVTLRKAWHFLNSWRKRQPKEAVARLHCEELLVWPPTDYCDYPSQKKNIFYLHHGGKLQNVSTDW